MILLGVRTHERNPYYAGTRHPLRMGVRRVTVPVWASVTASSLDPTTSITYLGPADEPLINPGGVAVR